MIQLKQLVRSVWRPLLYAPLLLDISMWKSQPHVQRWIAGLVIALLLIVLLAAAAVIWLFHNLWILLVVGLGLIVGAGFKKWSQTGRHTNPQVQGDVVGSLMTIALIASLVGAALIWLGPYLVLFALIGVVFLAVAAGQIGSEIPSEGTRQRKPQEGQNRHVASTEDCTGHIRGVEHPPSQRTDNHGQRPTPNASRSVTLVTRRQAADRPIEQMTGRDFEAYVGDLFRRWGYSVTPTQITNDQGVDLVLLKDSKKIAVQCKRMRSAVGNSAVQQVVAGRHMYGADEAWVVTSSTFTRSATDCARANKVRLIDGNELRRLQHSLAR